jgi:hypothetical protein
VRTVTAVSSVTAAVASRLELERVYRANAALDHIVGGRVHFALRVAHRCSDLGTGSERLGPGHIYLTTGDQSRLFAEGRLAAVGRLAIETARARNQRGFWL